MDKPAWTRLVPPAELTAPVFLHNLHTLAVALRRLLAMGQRVMRQNRVKVRAAVEGLDALKAASPTNNNTQSAKFDLALCTALAGPAFRAYAKVWQGSQQTPPGARMLPAPAMAHPTPHACCK